MANHEKIYGICENKCQHEIYRKDDADKTFLKKTDASSSYAIKNHATDKAHYGLGTPSLFGHVKITTALNISSNETQGMALAASAGSMLDTKISQLDNKLDNTAAQIDNNMKGIVTDFIYRLEKAQLPVNAVLCVTSDLNDPSRIADALGYGTWTYIGTLNPGSNVYFYKRNT